MKTFRYVAVMFVCFVAIVAVMAFADEEKRRDVLYSCGCGQDCSCNSVSTEPGNCKCGKPMKWGHVIKIDGTDASLCTCAEGCKCSIDQKDPSKCGCGNPVKKACLRATGIYFCNCGGSCTCNTVSSQPGKCKCGMDLKKVDELCEKRRNM